MKDSRTHSLLREKIGFNDMNIDEMLDIQHNQLSTRAERWNQRR